MRIDETHKPWAILTAAGTVAGAIAYAIYAVLTPAPGGGTAVGLTFGVIALGLMLFAALLSLRKRFPIWRIGRTTKWMRAHLWLGFLALPMVLFHAAFHARGALTGILMALTFIVVLSGIAGAWLQHTLPTRIYREVPFETIYDQIPVIRAQLAGEARELSAQVTQSLAPALAPGATKTDTLLGIEDLEPVTQEFDQFIAAQVAPYLTAEQARNNRLRNRERAREEFDNFRRRFPEPAWKSITAIEEICEEKRQLDHQARLHRTLHGWLLVHLPLSAALILLAIIHAIGALHF
jgi:hypothetical protein